MILTILLYFLGGCALWTVGWIAFYHLFERQHDASGDAGLAVSVIALVWAIPVLLLLQKIYEYFYPPPPPPTQEQIEAMIRGEDEKAKVHEKMVEEYYRLVGEGKLAEADEQLHRINDFEQEWGL